MHIELPSRSVKFCVYEEARPRWLVVARQRVAQVELLFCGMVCFIHEWVPQGSCVARTSNSSTLSSLRKVAGLVPQADSFRGSFAGDMLRLVFDCPVVSGTGYREDTALHRSSLVQSYSKFAATLAAIFDRF